MSAAHQIERVPAFTEVDLDGPYELAVARRAEGLDASYALLFCLVRSLGLGRSLDYDPATHEFVSTSHAGEVRHPAGRFEGWAP